jgi:hypothetical protein
MNNRAGLAGANGGTFRVIHRQPKTMSAARTDRVRKLLGTEAILSAVPTNLVGDVRLAVAVPL